MVSGRVIKIEQVKGSPAVVDNSLIYEACKPYFPVNRRTALDLGAYHGEWSRMMANDFERVYAFEVRPENHRVLSYGLPWNVVPQCTGLGIKREKARFVLRRDYAQLDILGRDGEREEYTVRPLDDFGFSVVDFIKVDVDGSEWDVLHGAIETIRRCKPVIVVDVKFLEAWAKEHLLRFLSYRCAGKVSPIDEVWVGED